MNAPGRPATVYDAPGIAWTLEHLTEARNLASDLRQTDIVEILEGLMGDLESSLSALALTLPEAKPQ